MKIKKIITVSFIVFIIAACEKSNHNGNNPPNPSNNLKITDSTMNFDAINTIYDDYNVTAPIINANFPIIFSSNRQTEGGNFDIVYKTVRLYINRRNGTLTLDIDTFAVENKDSGNILIEATNKINTKYNEYGPYLIPFDNQPMYLTYNYMPKTYMLLYSNDCGGDQNIYCTHNSLGEFCNPYKIYPLNTKYNDAYPCFFNYFHSIIFSSDRDGNFDIYRLTNTTFLSILNKEFDYDDTTKLMKQTKLNSDYNDHCPFIMANNEYIDIQNKERDKFEYIFFASDRMGGYGGYDLYYAKRDSNGWAKPVNMGSNINTSYDEFRPIVMYLDFYNSGFYNDIMFFSSNRPGGKGGFDLYYVGIDVLRN